jgi:hypothetical protein
LFIVRHDQMAKIASGHEFNGLGEIVLRTQRNYIFGHHVSYSGRQFVANVLAYCLDVPCSYVGDYNIHWATLLASNFAAQQGLADEKSFFSK